MSNRQPHNATFWTNHNWPKPEPKYEQVSNEPGLTLWIEASNAYTGWHNAQLIADSLNDFALKPNSLIKLRTIIEDARAQGTDPRTAFMELIQAAIDGTKPAPTQTEKPEPFIWHYQPPEKNTPETNTPPTPAQHTKAQLDQSENDISPLAVTKDPHTVLQDLISMFGEDHFVVTAWKKHWIPA